MTEIITGIAGYEGEVRYDGTPRKLLDVNLLEALRWRSKILLRKGIEDISQWYMENKIPDEFS